MRWSRPAARDIESSRVVPVWTPAAESAGACSERLPYHAVAEHAMGLTAFGPTWAAAICGSQRPTSNAVASGNDSSPCRIVRRGTGKARPPDARHLASSLAAENMQFDDREH